QIYFQLSSKKLFDKEEGIVVYGLSDSRFNLFHKYDSGILSLQVLQNHFLFLRHAILACKIRTI
ncbi:MAG TPA: hypothetical protein PLQ78_01020, partial [Flavipsychrobacter sp.]|nr:hypothetical protein [Flavipsychrobacter sp.]